MNTVTQSTETELDLEALPQELPMTTPIDQIVNEIALDSAMEPALFAHEFLVPGGGE